MKCRDPHACLLCLRTNKWSRSTNNVDKRKVFKLSLSKWVINILSAAISETSPSLMSFDCCFCAVCGSS